MKPKQAERTYRDLCPQGTPETVRRKYNIGDIFLNQVKCLSCGDIITSQNRHDFVGCSCKSVAVDGGSWMMRRLFGGKGEKLEYQEMSIPYEQDVASDIE